MRLYTIKKGTHCLVAGLDRIKRYKTTKHLAFVDSKKASTPEEAVPLNLGRHMCFRKNEWVIIVPKDRVGDIISDNDRDV